MKKILIILIPFLTASMMAVAQIPPAGGGGLPPDGIPIDGGGLGLLLTCLIGYAFIKFNKKYAISKKH